MHLRVVGSCRAAAAAPSATERRDLAAASAELGELEGVQVEFVHWEPTAAAVAGDALVDHDSILVVPPALELRRGLEALELELQATGGLLSEPAPAPGGEGGDGGQGGRGPAVGVTRGSSFEEAAALGNFAALPHSRHRPFAGWSGEYAGAARGRRAFAVIVPFYKNLVPLLIEGLREWQLDHFFPCRPGDRYGPPADLIFHYVRDLSEEPGIEPEVREALRLSEEGSFARRCFREVRFVSAGLDVQQAVYPRGVTLRFFLLSTDAALKARYDYYFLMDTDVKAVRRDWLDELRRLAYSSEPFWMMGSIDRSSWERPYWWMVLNGNAIYSLSDGFSEYVRRMFGGYTGGYTFDVGLVHYLRDQEWRLMQRVFGGFVYGDFVQHWGKVPWSWGALLAHHPATFLVHGDIRWD
eukprot:tig00000970_g5826.t1